MRPLLLDRQRVQRVLEHLHPSRLIATAPERIMDHGKHGLPDPTRHWQPDAASLGNGQRTTARDGVAQGRKLPTLATQPSCPAPCWFMLPPLTHPTDGRVALDQGSVAPPSPMVSVVVAGDHSNAAWWLVRRARRGHQTNLTNLPLTFSDRHGLIASSGMSQGWLKCQPWPPLPSPTRAGGVRPAAPLA